MFVTAFSRRFCNEVIPVHSKSVSHSHFTNRLSFVHSRPSSRVARARPASLHCLCGSVGWVCTRGFFAAVEDPLKYTNRLRRLQVVSNH